MPIVSRFEKVFEYSRPKSDTITLYYNIYYIHFKEVFYKCYLSFCSTGLWLSILLESNSVFCGFARLLAIALFGPSLESVMLNIISVASYAYFSRKNQWRFKDFLSIFLLNFFLYFNFCIRRQCKFTICKK